MPRLRWPFFCFSSLAIGALLATHLAGQTLEQDLASFVETPAVPGYEQGVAEQILARLKSFSPQQDHLGNLYLTLGNGSPYRLIVAPMDEPGYVVSGITADGYLRVQRLPQLAPNPVFDLLHAAQPVVVGTRQGHWIPGVVAGLSTHLQPYRLNAPRGSHPDDMYIDIGASSAAQVRQAGIQVLDPVALDRKLYAMGFGRMAAASVGDRFGCAALVELLRRIDPRRVRGTITIGFVAQQWADRRGFDRLQREVKSDEVVYVGRLLARRPTPGRATEATPPLRQARALPGSGVAIGVPDPDAALTGVGLELKQLGDRNKIPVAADYSTPLPRSRYAAVDRESEDRAAPSAHLAIPTKWATTPAEYLDTSDLGNLVALLELYVQGTFSQRRPPAGGAKQILLPHRRGAVPTNQEILETLVETYAVSGHEVAMREAIAQLLPAWAKPETDSAGNLILRIGAPANKKTGARLAFIAHMDEIGYVVRSIGDDGVLVVESRGGAMSEFFSGHAVLVDSAGGMRPGVLELPIGWDRPGFEWPRRAEPGELNLARVEIGAHNASEVEQLGVKPGDAITVPKKYRRLFGGRASGRSLDDRVGCAALISAAWALQDNPPGREVVFIWSTEEEVGLRGAARAADRLQAASQVPEYVFAIDTFVSADSPLESQRFAYAPLGKGFVIRAVDNSNITSRPLVDRLASLARTNRIPVQYGVTGGGNDGASFLRYGSIDLPISWPLRYAHTPGEVIDLRDLDALARIVAVIARNW